MLVLVFEPNTIFFFFFFGGGGGGGGGDQKYLNMDYPNVTCDMKKGVTVGVNNTQILLLF